jgi:lysozyme
MKISTISENALILVKLFEGCKLEAYQDSVGIWTIGYGHTKGIKKGDKITQEQATKFLHKDLDIHSDPINKLVKVNLSQNQYDALASFIFNLGGRNFSTSTLLKKLNQEDYQATANEFPRWNKAGGKVLRGLTRRRECEKFLFLGDFISLETELKPELRAQGLQFIANSSIKDSTKEEDLNKKEKHLKQKEEKLNQKEKHLNEVLLSIRNLSKEISYLEEKIKA